MATVIGGLLSSSLARRHRFEVLSTYRTSDRLGRMAVFSLALVRLIAWCAGGGARVIHVHSTVRGSMYRKAVCVAVAKGMRRPVLVHVHAGATEIEVFRRRLGSVPAWLVRHGIGMADRIVTVSEAGKVALERCFELPDVSVVPNAAPAVLESSGDRVEQDGVGILYLGGFANPVKGGDVLLEALASVLAAAASVRVLLAGPGEPPEAAGRLLEEHASIRWLGWLDEHGKANALGRSDVFVLPSTSEGLPMALLEAMAHGLAVVATDMGGIPDILTDEVDALLVPPGDPESLGRALLHLTENPARRDALARKAVARAQCLNEDEVCGRLDAIYRELIGG
jgi:glycosyltransferase involved in cell wall biosynthesis